MKQYLILFGLLFPYLLWGQQEEGEVMKVRINGHILTQYITPTGDTLLLADLNEMSITSPRTFASNEEYRLYRKYRAYAIKVYPYAKEAVKIFQETDLVTQKLSKRKAKKHVKRLQKELEEKFEEPLKKLTRTQGKIMVKMIERELDRSMYDLIKGLRGSVTATYWSSLSRFYGYRLKDKYQPGEDEIMDIVLQDFNISYKTNGEATAKLR